MQYQLRQTLVFLDGHPINKPEVMVARAAEAFDGNGTLINEFYRTQVAQLLEAPAGLPIASSRTTEHPNRWCGGGFHRVRAHVEA